MSVKRIFTVDSHTMGESTRVIIGGMPIIKGNTMAEKRDYMMNNLDHIRKTLMLEPRGHQNMFGSIIVEPCNPKADLGVIFMDGGGYLNMCGHGSIGTITVAVETGIVTPNKKGLVYMDTAAGLIEANVVIKDERVETVSFRNVESFLYKKDLELEIDDLKFNYDISFGGSFFALVAADDVNLEIKPENAEKFLKLGLKIRDKINKSVEIQHPTLKHIKKVDLVEFYNYQNSEGCDYRNTVVFGKAQVDRSPCGTGTCAKMAALYKRGEMKKGESIVNRSILGTDFKGEIYDTLDFNGYDAIIPQITASAYIYGYNQIIIDDHDPLKAGFLL